MRVAVGCLVLRSCCPRWVQGLRPGGQKPGAAGAKEGVQGARVAARGPDRSPETLLREGRQKCGCREGDKGSKGFKRPWRSILFVRQSGGNQ